MWDGDDVKLQIFQTNAMITYPLLKMGGSHGIQAAYDCLYDVAFVIDGEGTIRYRGLYFDDLVRDAVETAISELDPTPVEPTSFGGVKALYR